MDKPPYLYFQPDKTARLGNLNLLVRGVVEGFISGLHRSPHHGFSAEFAEHREYSHGDDIRHVDWFAWGRSDRLYIKQYEQETNLRAHILLDASASMNYSSSGPTTKFTYGCFLAACLSYLMCRQQDSVGLIAFDEQVRFHLSCGSTPGHMDRLFRRLEQLTPGGRTAVASTFHHLARRIGKRGLIVVISDLYDEPTEVTRALRHFVHKKHQIIVFHVLDRAELDLPFGNIVSLVDMETHQRLQIDPRYVRSAYRREMDAFVAAYRRDCGERNIEYVLTTTDVPYERMLLDYLIRRKRFLR